MQQNAKKLNGLIETISKRVVEKEINDKYLISRMAVIVNAFDADTNTASIIIPTDLHTSTNYKYPNRTGKSTLANTIWNGDNIVVYGDKVYLVYQTNNISQGWLEGNNPLEIGNTDLSNYYTKTETNGLLDNKLNLSGGTMTGNLIVPNVIATGQFNGILNGNASTATILATARNFITDLTSTTSASFNGSADATLGVSGILPVANGGTGQSSLDSVSVNYATTAGTATTMSVESKTVTYSDMTSGVTVNWMVAYKSGNVVSIYFKFTKSASTSSGSNVLTCTLTNMSGWLPPYDVEGFGYYSSCSFGIRLESDGSLTVRNASASSRTLSDGIQFHLTYVI